MMENPWQPMATLPLSGNVLLAKYAPTSWAYYVTSDLFYPDMPPKLREMRCRWAVAWAPIPPEPPSSFRDDANG
jgi:hypothetical protein